MAVVNKSTIDGITKTFTVVFNKAFAAAPNRIDEIATHVPSTSDAENVPIAALGSDMEEWFGDRTISDLAAWNKSIANRNWQKAVAIAANAVADDKTGLYKSSIETLGQLAAGHPWRRALDALMTDGFDSDITGYDSVEFFSAAHSFPGAYDTAQDNYTDELLDAAAVWTAIEYFREVKGPDGICLDLDVRSPNAKFICAADEEETARKLFIPGAQADSDTHSLVGRFKPEDIIVSGRITANRWAILYTGMPVKPLVNLVRQAAQFVAMTRVDDEQVFTSGKLRWGVDYRGTVMALAWWLAYGSDGSGS